jgi:hypothetical protein
MKLVIDRKLWIRGFDAKTASALMVEDSRMCCLGFHSLACGIKKEEIDPNRPDTVLKFTSSKMVQYPVELINKKIRETLPETMHWLFFKSAPFSDERQGKVRFVNSADAYDLARTNDKSDLSDEEREKKIAEIFAKHDVEVEFIN